MRRAVWSHIYPGLKEYDSCIELTGEKECRAKKVTGKQKHYWQERVKKIFGQKGEFDNVPMKKF